MEAKTGISFKLKIGYSVANLGNSVIYSTLMVYSLFFLTDIVQLNPAAAGNVILIATTLNAVFMILIGYLSDYSRLKSGRRLPYMFVSILPMFILSVSAFTVVDFPGYAKIIYYILANSLLWFSYSAFQIPHVALGAEIVSEASEKIALRSYSRFFMTAGNFIALVFTIKLVDLFQSYSYDSGTSWQKAIIIVSGLGMVSVLASCIILKKSITEKQNLSSKKRLSSLFYDYFAILKLKPCKHLTAHILFFSVAYLAFNSTIVYFMKYNLSLSSNVKIIAFTLLPVIGATLTPFLYHAAIRYGSPLTVAACHIISGFGLIFLGISGINNMVMLCLAVAVFTLGSSAYWQLIYAILYDLSKFDTLENYQRREGIIISLSNVLLRIGTALSAQILSLFLQYFGYDGSLAVQSASTVKAIEIAFIYIPAVFFILAAVSLIRYPLSKV